MMGFVVPWMFLDVGAPLCPVLFATDAQGVNDLDAGGFGIVARAAPPPMIQRVFEQGSCVGRTVSRLSGDLSGLRRPERAITPTVPFTLLPADLFVLAEWLEVDRGRWLFEDHVTLGESRAVIRLLDILTRSHLFYRMRLQSLQDNQPTAGAFAKGRSPSPALNYLLRRRAARTLASSLRLMLPWVESCKMPADESSRISDQ